MQRTVHSVRGRAKLLGGEAVVSARGRVLLVGGSGGVARWARGERIRTLTWANRRKGRSPKGPVSVSLHVACVCKSIA